MAIIKVGNQPDSKITAFGDDCKFQSVNAYAYVVIENEKLDLTKDLFLSVKEKYGIPSHVLLHMRDLKDSRYRVSKGIEHLTQSKIMEMVGCLIEEMNSVPILIKASYYFGELPSDLVDVGPEGKKDLLVQWSDKGMQSLLAKHALMRLNLKNYSLFDLRIIISRDETQVPFLGKRKRQAARWARGFSAIGAPSGYTYEFEPIIEDPKKEILLQMADIVTYLVAHAFSPDRGSLVYRVLLDKFRNIDVRPLLFTPESEPPQ